MLAEHPEISLPKSKREKIYLGGPNFRGEDAKQFFTYIPGGPPPVGDASVEYFFDPKAPETVVRFARNTKVIVCLRDPVDRAVSGYYWNLRRGNLRHTNLNQAMVSAAKEWRKMPELKNLNPPNILHNIVARGIYSRQLERYIQYFSPQQIFVVEYASLRSNPLDTIQNIYRFLGVSDTYKPQTLSQRPKKTSYVKLILKVESTLPNSPYTGFLFDHLHQIAYKAGFGRNKPRLLSTVDADLRDLYSTYNHELREQLATLPQQNRPFWKLDDLWRRKQRT